MPTDTLEMPTWDQVNERMNHYVTENGEWAGAPRLCSIPLVLEERYPFQGLNGMTAPIFGEENERKSSDDGDDPVRIINSWWCENRCATVFLWEEPSTGKRHVCWMQDQGWPHRLKRLMDNFDPASILDADAEFRAMETLRTLVKPNQWRLYVLTGAFPEQSDRSDLTYIFRKGMPTLALTGRPHGRMRLLTALCLHPIGYYENTSIGAMVPTDDVIAHLLMMRGDEWKFWSKANHHEPHVIASGL